MDRTYKEDIPSTRRALEELKKEFSSIASTTDWTKLRIEPLLDHVKFLERLLRSPKFARQNERLRRGVVMFHSDLVYLRENVKALGFTFRAIRGQFPSCDDTHSSTQLVHVSEHGRHSPNQSLEPTALWRCASKPILISAVSTGAQPRSQSGGSAPSR